MESKSVSGVASTCCNPCMTPVGHTGDDMAYLCSLNLLPSLRKCNSKFQEKFKGSLIFGSTYIFTLIFVTALRNQINLYFHVNCLPEDKKQNVNFKVLFSLKYQERYMGLVVTKPVFKVSGKARLKPVSSATETG